ncbi:MAG: hypothetical protein K9M10_03335 [Candidatus Pacebacteria bacterium]|nr:hypothetical protein [Candidatus Paceibacterota bacterium]MCF7857487.1 hypothetical protein [Candidatus Paceibacterota bacterium]
MSPTFKKLIAALCVIVLLGGVYVYVSSRNSDSEMVLSSGEFLSPEAAQRTEEVLRNIQEIDGYKLDDTLFLDRRFTSLVDTRIELIDIRTGRYDPFVPVN